MIRTVAEEKIFFQPSREMSQIPPGSGIKNIIIPTNNGGGILKCYYRKPRPGMPTMMFLHGVRRNASFYLNRMPGMFLKKEGYGLLLAEYRGFGESTQAYPSEESIYEDAQSAVEFLKNSKNTPAGKIILWGYSLGGAAAAELATKQPFKALILDSTFTSVSDVAERGLGGKILNSMLLRSEFNNIEKMSKIKSPVLILHSRGDKRIPAEMAEQNFRELKASGNVSPEMVIHTDAKHGAMGWKAVPIRQFLDRVG